MQIDGALDGCVFEPFSVNGWARSDIGKPLYVEARLNGETVAGCATTLDRRDIGGPHGFRLEIPGEGSEISRDLLAGRLEVYAVGSEAERRLGVYHVFETKLLTNLLASLVNRLDADKKSQLIEQFLRQIGKNREAPEPKAELRLISSNEPLQLSHRRANPPAELDGQPCPPSESFGSDQPPRSEKYPSEQNVGADTLNFPERIRFVIWDLDDTFWKGTLTEGGIRYSDANHNIVIELAKRGIISSVCSKNDASTTIEVLRDRCILEFFVNPSISWDSKGPRIKKLVEWTNLRAETVLFIDDNPMNRAEAVAFCPGINVADVDIIDKLLANAFFVGKDDQKLTRLAQYKVLEARAIEMESSRDNMSGFLRDSNIRVYIQYDVEDNIERAVELINRTNQLNFTKIRLDEDVNQAARDLREQLAGYDVNAGLVWVVDNYGDYGCIGFFLLHDREGMGRRLDHFCFSCRTLGMKIEAWLYNRLGRPRIKVAGEVLTDLNDPSSFDVDWVHEVGSLAELKSSRGEKEVYGTAVIKGGCDLRAVRHYLSGNFSRIAEEMNDVRLGIPLRLDHSIFLSLALKGDIGDDWLDDMQRLAYAKEHATTALLEFPDDKYNLAVLSFWSDGRMALYKHKKSGLTITCTLPNLWVKNLLAESDDVNTEKDCNWNAATLNVYREIRDNYEYIGPIAFDAFRATMETLKSKIHASTFYVFVDTPTFWKRKDGTRHDLYREPRLNEIVREVFADCANATWIKIQDEAKYPDDYLDFFHFTRPVYRRVANVILDRFKSWVDETERRRLQKF